MSNPNKTAPYPDLVGIDTNTIIHALKESFRDEAEEEQCRRARCLLRDLVTQKVKVCISIISVAEYLAGIDAANRSAQVAALRDSFTIAPFNVKAAVLAADYDSTFPRMTGKERRVIKADIKIYASLVALGVGRFYSDDREFVRAATLHGVVQAFEIPEFIDLFDKLDES